MAEGLARSVVLEIAHPGCEALRIATARDRHGHRPVRADERGRAPRRRLGLAATRADRHETRITGSR
jgi:hypothetical protein